MIKRVPVKDAMNNNDFLMQGEAIDVLPHEQDVYVDPRTGQSFDTSDRVALRDLPQSGVIRLPKTTWGAPPNFRTSDAPIKGRRLT